MPRVVGTRPISGVGVGRRDYSQATSYHVEPVISGPQALYSYIDLVTVPVGGDLEIDIDVDLDQVVLVYDYMVSIPSNHLVGMYVEAVSDSDVESVVYKVDYQTAEVHLVKGFSFFETIRLTLSNSSSEDYDHTRVSLTGLYTSKTEYWLSTG